ncbi:von Willebrand factor type A domain-containing protein [Leeia sp.]|uniref:vWA domain-containing protein n=1 Tax=Leeia sp. TaxID=2884678 RepID=UPI0035B240D4
MRITPALPLLPLVLLLSACQQPQQTTSSASSSTGGHKPLPPQVSTVPPEALDDVPPQAPLPSAQLEVKKQERAAPAGALRDKDVRVAESAAPMAVEPEPAWVTPPANTEVYDHLKRNSVVSVAQDPISTFSIDVDTGSYSNVRRMLNQGTLPPADAVRVEELVNYFPYQYPQPVVATGGKVQPFTFSTEMAPAPWNPNSHLLKIGIKATDAATTSLPPANLVFLVDVSGSMDEPNKLPLLKNALRLLINQLRPQDKVSLVTYAQGSRAVLEPTTDREKLRNAIERLQPGGGTAGAAGIELAYRMARQGYLDQGINRILLCTDGDFNVGISDFNQLKQMVEERRKSGVSLSTLGFGEGNLNDRLMEQLADAGDGQYAYIDNLNEAQKVLVDEFSASMATVAKDVKLQLEFNPAQVSEYRLIGFENRALKTEDFDNDRVDAGEIGAGHTVTALYEVTLVGQAGRLPTPRYAPAAGKPAASPATNSNELAFLKVRYKAPGSNSSQLLTSPVWKQQIKPLAQTSDDFRFAAAVAAFGQQLSEDGKYLGQFGWDDIIRLGEGARGADRFGYRAEWLKLARLAKSLSSSKPQGRGLPPLYPVPQEG